MKEIENLNHEKYSNIKSCRCWENTEEIAKQEWFENTIYNNPEKYTNYDKNMLNDNSRQYKAFYFYF